MLAVPALRCTPIGLHTAYTHSRSHVCKGEAAALEAGGLWAGLDDDTFLCPMGVCGPYQAGMPDGGFVFVH